MAIIYMNTVSYFKPNNQSTRLSNIRQQILDSQSLPFTHQTFNISLLLKENEELIEKLIDTSNQLQQITKTMSKNDQHMKSRSVNKLIKPASVPAPNSTLKYRNEHLRKQIHRISEQFHNQLMKQNQRLKDRKEEINELSSEIDEIHNQNQMLSKVVNKKTDMFEQYEKMCRKCQAKRKENDVLSQSIKKCIEEINQLTGSEENPNFFLMKFK